jgi:hypothetical protein
MSQTPQAQQESTLGPADTHTFDGFNTRFHTFREPLLDLLYNSENDVPNWQPKASAVATDLDNFYKAVESYEPTPRDWPSIEHMEARTRRVQIALAKGRLNQLERLGEQKIKGHKQRDGTLDVMHKTSGSVGNSAAYEQLTNFQVKLEAEIRQLWNDQMQCVRDLNELLHSPAAHYGYGYISFLQVASEKDEYENAVRAIR